MNENPIVNTLNQLRDPTLPNSLKLDDADFEQIFPVYQTEEGFYFLNILNTISFPEDLDPNVYEFYDINTQETWLKISDNIYGTTKLWWILIKLNKIANTVALPRAGQRIKYIKPLFVRDILTELKEQVNQ